MSLRFDKFPNLPKRRLNVAAIVKTLFMVKRHTSEQLFREKAQRDRSDIEILPILAHAPLPHQSAAPVEMPLEKVFLAHTSVGCGMVSQCRSVVQFFSCFKKSVAKLCIFSGAWNATVRTWAEIKTKPSVPCEHLFAVRHVCPVGSFREFNFLISKIEASAQDTPEVVWPAKRHPLGRFESRRDSGLPACSYTSAIANRHGKSVKPPLIERQIIIRECENFALRFLNAAIECVRFSWRWFKDVTKWEFLHDLAGLIG